MRECLDEGDGRRVVGIYVRCACAVGRFLAGAGYEADGVMVLQRHDVSVIEPIFGNVWSRKC